MTYNIPANYSYFSEVSTCSIPRWEKALLTFNSVFAHTILHLPLVCGAEGLPCLNRHTERRCLPVQANTTLKQSWHQLIVYLEVTGESPGVTPKSRTTSYATLMVYGLQARYGWAGALMQMCRLVLNIIHNIHSHDNFEKVVDSRFIKLHLLLYMQLNCSCKIAWKKKNNNCKS